MVEDEHLCAIFIRVGACFCSPSCYFVEENDKPRIQNLLHNLTLKPLMRKEYRVAQLVGASSCKVKGRSFDSQLGSMPRLWVQSQSEVCRRGNPLMFSSSLPPSPSLLKRKKENL